MFLTAKNFGLQEENINITNPPLIQRKGRREDAAFNKKIRIKA